MKSSKPLIYVCVFISLALAGASEVHAERPGSGGAVVTTVTGILVEESVVHSKWIADGMLFLKVELPDGSKVAASCETTDCILNECQQSTIGMNAAGYARCENGTCEWTAFGSDYNGPPGC